MGILITWEEFIRRTDPQGKAGMTAKKFQSLIVAMLYQAARRVQPCPKDKVTKSQM